MKEGFKLHRFIILALSVGFLGATASTVFSSDFDRIRDLFADARQKNTVVTIPPGDYRLDGREPIALHSNSIVSAYGARFHFLESLSDQARVVLFSGENIRNLTWHGGHFEGHVFDPNQAKNSWPPNANTRAIVIATTTGGKTENLTFRDVTSNGLAGAAITVLGASKAGSDRDIETFAKNVTIENCTLQRSGKFMWDYGFLWQIMVWPEEYTEAERAMAAKYFRNDLVRDKLRMQSGDDRVYLENTKPLPRSVPRSGADADRGYDAICFFGDDLPSNIVRGRQYFVVDSQPEYIRIADSPGGKPLSFASSAGPSVKLITNLFQANLALYAPQGSGPGKGAIDLVGCNNVIVRGCRLSALGDTMHIQKSHGIVFNGNQITGSRMGAFFLAEFCKNAVVSGNTIDGTNGSRVMSVEKSCEDVVITGNTFRGGGRGSWINQPSNFILSDNIFVNNTTKCQHDPKLGRRSFLTGDYERYAELYFTTYEPGGKYGNVTVRGNTFISGPDASHAITFAEGGTMLRVENNTFAGPIRTIAKPIGCEEVVIRENPGLIEAGLPIALEQKRVDRVGQVVGQPGLVAFWDFVKREPAGNHRFTAHVPSDARNDFALDAANYIKDYWGEGRDASYADFPMLGRGPFGNAIRVRKEEDPNFRPFLFVPRERLHDTPLDIKGSGKSLSVVAWAIRESGNHALAGIWHEGTDLKQQETASIQKVQRGQRQYALFAGLNKGGSACGHLSENGASSFLNKYALHKCNSIDQSPEVPADSPAELLDASWQCFAMTFDHERDELTGWLNGVSGDRWLENPKNDNLIKSAYNAYMQGYWHRLPGEQPGEDMNFPKDQFYTPPEEKVISLTVVTETAEERTEIREFQYTKINVTLKKDADGNLIETSRDLIALRLNPWWYPHDLYEPKNDGSGGPFTIGRVIHSSRGVGFTGWIGGVAVFDRALSAEEIAKLAAIRKVESIRTE